MKPMTDAELDEAMAIEVMGLDLHNAEHGHSAFYYDKNKPGFIDYSAFRPTTDLNQAWECEERLNELGLTEKYLFDLKKKFVFGLQPIISRPSVDWYIAHATARQRCEVLLMAGRGEI